MSNDSASSDEIRWNDFIGVLSGQTDEGESSVLGEITKLTEKTLKIPSVFVMLVDGKKRWHAVDGKDEFSATRMDFPFGDCVVGRNGLLVVEDARDDGRFATDSLVTGPPHIRFFAGVPLRNPDGVPIGSLNIADSAPRSLRPDEQEFLVGLAGVASNEIRARNAMLGALTERDRARRAMEKARELFLDVFNCAGVGIALILPDGRWLRINEMFCTITGYSRPELMRRNLEDITHEDDIIRDICLRRQILSGVTQQYEREKRYVRKDGGIRWVHVTVSVKRRADNTPEYLISVVKDIQARRDAEFALQALRNSLENQVAERTGELEQANRRLLDTVTQQVRTEQLIRKREAELSMILQNANDAYVCLDEDGIVTAWNRQAEDTFGWAVGEALGMRLDEMIIPPAQREEHRAGLERYLQTGEGRVLDQRLELIALHRSGREIPVELRIRALKNEGHTIFSAFLHDISDRKRIDAEREREARHDALTGLPNRRAMFEVLPQAMARVRRNRVGLALLFIDLDGFKPVNDTYGHQAGDRLLQEIGRRLCGLVRETDSVFRLGGDEFTVILERLVAGVDDARILAERLLARIQEPVFMQGASVSVGASIGIAIFTVDSACSPDALISDADTAMYEAKHGGKSCVRIGRSGSTVSLS